jgi:hypothetical protein
MRDISLGTSAPVDVMRERWYIGGSAWAGFLCRAQVFSSITSRCEPLRAAREGNGQEG